MRRQRLSRPVFAVFAACLLATALTACGTDKPATAADEPDTTVADGGVTPDGSAADAATDEDTGQDAVADTDQDTVEQTDTTVADTGADTAEIKCTSDNFCQTKLAAELKPCEQGVCNLGTGACEKAAKPNTCCDASQCVSVKNKPGKTCETATCNADTHTCVFAPVAKPPEGCDDVSITFVTEPFEQAGLVVPPDWKQDVQPPDGNVRWHVSTNRAHYGNRSLYLGNECKTYDASSTEKNGCKGTGGAQVQVKLQSKEANIPKGTKAIAHFWMYMEAESLFTQSDKLKESLGKKPLDKGTGCKPAPGAEPNKCSTDTGCAFGQTCVNLNGAPTCLEERDNLKLYIQVAGKKEAIWDAACIGKSTQGKWLHQLIDVSPYLSADKGTAFKLLFEFDTGGASLNTYEGVYIDDFVIETYAGLSACDKTTTCKPTETDPCDTEACTLALNKGSNVGVCFYSSAPNCCDAEADCDDANSCTIDKCAVQGTDKAGLCAHQPDAGNAQCCQESTALQDSFDTGSAGDWTWTVEKGKAVKWHTTTTNPAKGAQALCFSDDNGTGYADVSVKGGPGGTICSKKFKIEAGTNYNQLTFQVQMETEWSGQPPEKYINPPAKDPDKIALDKLRVFVVDAGQEVVLWNSDAIKGTTGNKGKDWQSIISYGLEQFKGQEKSICFGFEAGDNNGNANGRICVDEVAVKVTCSKIECDGKELKCDELNCKTWTCTSDFKCDYDDKVGCCVKAADCDDKNTCTEDKCGTDGKCINDAKDATCCANMSPKDGNAPLSEAFESANLPTGWTTAAKKGQPKFGNGASYATDHKWETTQIKSKPGSGNFSLHFGKPGTFNAGTDVAAGTIDTPAFPLQGSTKASSFAAFDLFLATEHDTFPYDSKLGTANVDVDRLQVYAADADVTPMKWEKVWDSYEIEGTTNGEWRSIVVALPKALAGKNAKLRFDFDAGNSKNNNFEGAYLDNFAIHTMCTAPTCGTVKECSDAGGTKCKKWYCGLDDKTMTPTCEEAFKAGAGCCQPKSVLPVETFETGKLLSFDPPSAAIGDVSWHIVKKGNGQNIPSYLNGNYEMRFGSASKPHYLTGSADACAVDTDCKNKEEKCANAGSGADTKKGCYLPVKGALTSKPITPPAASADTGFELRFKAFFDIEQQYETFEIWARDESNANDLKKLWSKTELKATEYKGAIDVKVDLGAMQTAGNKFRLQFRFDSGDASANDKYLGVHIDDVTVEATCK